jgi:hypothetical protein
MIVVAHGRKMVARKHPWSTIVRIASQPQHGESPVIRSIDMLWKGSVPGSDRMWNTGVFFQCIKILFC